jgi:hypothetical protein
MPSTVLSRPDILGVSFAAAAFAAFAAACSSSPQEDAIGSNGSLVINPVGTENESHLVLQLPTDACLPGATCAKVLGTAPVIYVDGVSTALGTNTRLKPGAHNVAVNNVGWSVTTTPDQSLTVTLPVADRVCTDATLPNLPTTNFGGSVSVSNAPCPASAQGSAVGVPANNANPALYYYSGCSYVLSNPASSYNCANATAGYSYSYINTAGACVAGGTGPTGCYAAQAQAEADSSAPGTAAITSAYEAYVPGTLTATVNGAAQSITLNAGDEVDFNLSLPALGNVPATFATDITFLDPRANPDAAKGTITSSCSGDASYTIPSATGTPAPLALNAFVNSACTYTLSVGGRTQVLSQTSTNDVNLRRLDVDNVTITREDGTTYTVVGTYTLNYGGIQVAGPYSTGTGIDALPGTYEFSLSYTDFDGLQTQTQTITL